MNNFINPILVVFIVLLTGALVITNQALHQKNDLVIQVQQDKDTIYVEIHDTVYLETKEHKPETENSFVDLTGLIGKQIEEISDTTDVGLEFHVKLVERLTARGYLPAEGELTYEMIHSAYHKSMNDYKIKDHAISEDMLIVFGMYTY